MIGASVLSTKVRLPTEPTPMKFYKDSPGVATIPTECVGIRGAQVLPGITANKVMRSETAHYNPRGHWAPSMRLGE